MSLLGIGIAAAGLYGLSMAWTEMSAATARRRLHDLEAKNGHIDVIKYFGEILAMVEIKPVDGVLPKDGYKECQDLMMLELMYVTKRDLNKFKTHYNKVRKQQMKERKQYNKNKMKEAEEFIKKYYSKSSNGYERYDRKNSYEKIEDTINRCNKLYQETPWRKIVKGPAKVINTPNGKTKEMWMVRKNWRGYAEPYRKCNKAIGYDVY